MTTTSNRLLRPFATSILPTMSRELDALQANIRRVFENPFAVTPFVADGFVTPMPQNLGWMPPVEIVETTDALVLTAELPGMTLENITLTIDGDVLTLKGEKAEKVEENEGEEAFKYHVFERAYGTFLRSFTLPRTIDATNVKASFVNGVLTCVLPKIREAKVKGTVIPIAKEPLGEFPLNKVPNAKN